MNCEKPLSGKSACTLKIRGGCERDCYGKKAGKGAGCCAIHQNASGEVQMSDVGYTVSTNSNASGRNTPIVLVYESHNQDSRYNPLGDICETVSAKYGTGGGNQPIVVKYEESICREEIL